MAVILFWFPQFFFTTESGEATQNMSSMTNRNPFGTKPGGDEPKAPKSLGELMTDPHFVITILSLCVSISVFFYYLYQLLCNEQDWNAADDVEADRKKKRRAQMLKDEAARNPYRRDGANTDLSETQAAEALIRQKKRQLAELQALQAKQEALEKARGASKKDDDVGEDGKPIGPGATATGGESAATGGQVKAAPGNDTTVKRRRAKNE